jgi:DNA-binding transcriptional LysR family regulator
MSDIDEMKLRRLDLTVLLVFLNLMRDRKAVLVADRMGLTKSSISHTLKRLRDTFGDPLFLRKPHGMEPTAVAQRLEPVIRRAVDALNSAFVSSDVFDPASAFGTVRIGAYDSEMAVLIPQMIACIRAEAPGLKFAARALGRRDALDALEGGELDLAIGFFWDLPSAFIAKPLHEEGYLTVARRGHALFEEEFDLKRYLAAGHLIVSPNGDLSGIVDRSLETLGKTRNVVCAVPQFFPALATLAASDLVATLPATLVRKFSASFDLDYREPPLEIRRFTISLVRHRRNEKNTKLDWIGDTMKDPGNDSYRKAPD